jgi:FkbM family methyltransferase
MKPFSESDRLNLPLTSESVVLDIGCHEGWFASELVIRFDCTIHAYEPIRRFFDAAAKRFTGNPKIHMWNFALGAEDGFVEMGVKGDLTGAFCREPNEQQRVYMRDIVGVIDNLELAEIDLATINCEGGEYAILERLIDSGVIRKIRNVSVQFHAVVPYYQARMERIVGLLKETHDHVYGSPFVWDGFKLRA